MAKKEKPEATPTPDATAKPPAPAPEPDILGEVIANATGKPAETPEPGPVKDAPAPPPKDVTPPVPAEDSHAAAKAVAPDPDPDTQTLPAEPPPKPEDELAKVKAERDTLEKRFKDTQAELTRKAQALAELEKAREAKPKRIADDDDWFDDDDKGKPKPEAELTAEIKAMREEVAEMRRQRNLDRWDTEEAKFKAGKPDYEKVVYEVLEPAMKDDTALREEFVKAGGTPEAAYRLGAQLRERQEFLKDPEAYKKRVAEEALTAAAKTKPGGNGGAKKPEAAPVRDLGDVPGGGNAPGGPVVYAGVLDDVIAETTRPRNRR